MLTYKESSISAYHNYLVNHMLTPGFILGDPDRPDDFYFIADIVLPGETLASVSGRLFDSQGRLLLHLLNNRLENNPQNCTIQSSANGFRIHSALGEPLLTVLTQAYTNGYLTMIQGKLYDPAAKIRMEPSFQGITVYGSARLVLDVPFHARK
ncbi:MAG: hypothetical protein EHM45_18160 [Desulfobacteraceae bacterium]|nr:MAG: hypothetical protein EHM45_18160 [Desulfobacteraceae bacterium]